MSIDVGSVRETEWERCDKSRTFAIRITHVSDSTAQAINDVICTNQPPGACEINWVDTVDAGRRRLRDGTTMTYVIVLTQDVSDVSMNATTALLTAATINAALVATGNGNVVITTEPVQDLAVFSLTITTTAKIGSTCVEGNEGVLCAVCAEGFFRPSSFAVCKPCGNETWALLSAAGMVFLMILALAIFIQINRRTPSGLLRPFINLVQQLTVMLVRASRCSSLPPHARDLCLILRVPAFCARSTLRSSLRQSRSSRWCWRG